MPTKKKETIFKDYFSDMGGTGEITQGGPKLREGTHFVVQSISQKRKNQSWSTAYGCRRQGETIALKIHMNIPGK